MKLTILGGSAAGPNPGQGCSGYLVESESTRIVLDLGPGTLPELRRHTNFRNLDAVILSHLHLDHMLDVLALRFALTYNPVEPLSPAPLWLPPGGRDYLDRLGHVLAGQGHEADYFAVYDINEYDPGKGIEVGDLTVRFAPTVHYVACWAMRVSHGRDGDLFYTADTGPTADLSGFAHGSVIVVAEGTARPGEDEPLASRGHLTPAEAGTLARQADARVLVLTHLWAENAPYRAIGQAEGTFSGRVILATPGLQVRWRAGAIEGR